MSLTVHSNVCDNFYQRPYSYAHVSYSVDAYVRIVAVQYFWVTPPHVGDHNLQCMLGTLQCVEKRTVHTVVEIIFVP